MLSLLFIFLFGIAEGAKDILSFRYSKSIFSNYNKNFWDPQASWINKYKKNKLNSSPNPWYYFGLYKPRYKEKFPYSTTFLVFLTDGWHLCKGFSLLFLFLSLVLYSPLLSIWGDIWIYFIVYSMSFNLFENKLFHK